MSQVEFDDEVQDLDPSYQGLQFCPNCCTTVDVAGAGTQQLECGTCGQIWVQTVSPERVASHSIA